MGITKPRCFASRTVFLTKFLCGVTYFYLIDLGVKLPSLVIAVFEFSCLSSLYFWFSCWFTPIRIFLNPLGPYYVLLAVPHPISFYSFWRLKILMWVFLFFGWFFTVSGGVNGDRTSIIPPRLGKFDPCLSCCTINFLTFPANLFGNIFPWIVTWTVRSFTPM